MLQDMLNSIALFGPFAVAQSVRCAPTSRALVIVELQQPERINPVDRIGRVLEYIDPTSQPDRILADEPSATRIVIPMPVIVQLRLLAATTDLSAFAISCSDAPRIHRHSGIVR